MAIQTNVRFFTYDDKGDVMEIAEFGFKALAAWGNAVSYERHTFANGVDQICLTVEPC
jgi:hypothetical protein